MTTDVAASEDAIVGVLLCRQEAEKDGDNIQAFRLEVAAY